MYLLIYLFSSRGGVTLKRHCTYRPSVIYLIVNKLLPLPLPLSLLSSSPPTGGVTRQGVVLTDLQSLLDCQQNFSLSLSLSLSALLSSPL